MFKNILTFSFFTLISRILGLIRDTLVAFYLGAESLADIFFVAFRLPNLFRASFAEGAFTIAFIPLYSAQIDNKKHAAIFASNVFSILLMILVLFCLVLCIFSPYLIKFFTPGFYQDANKFNLTVELSRIMLPYLLFVSLASLIGGMLQVNNHFISTAASPIILNVCLISSLFLPYLLTPAHNLAVAVFVAGILQFLLILFAALKMRLGLRFVFKIKIDNDVKIFLKRIVPTIFSNCITQISIWVDTIFASFIPGAVSYIYYADRINQLPQALIGVAIGTVLLPLVSKQIRNQKIEEAIETQNKALELGLMFTIPAAAALAIMPDAILLTLLGYGKFDYTAVQNTVPVLMAFSFSLPAFVMSKIFLPGFYARGNIKVPAIFSLISLIINIILNFVLMKRYQYVGIAVATSISSWVNVTLLILYLKSKNLYKINNILLSKLTSIFLSTIAMMFVILITHTLLEQFFLERLIIKLSALVVLIASGTFVYFAMLRLTLKENFLSLKELFKK